MTNVTLVTKVALVAVVSEIAKMLVTIGAWKIWIVKDALQIPDLSGVL